jgi:hypothetical protein
VPLTQAFVDLHYHGIRHIASSIEALTMPAYASLSHVASTDAVLRDLTAARAADLADTHGRKALLDYAIDQVRRSAYGAPDPAVNALIGGITAMIMADLLDRGDYQLLLQPIHEAARHARTAGTHRLPRSRPHQPRGWMFTQWWG